MTNSPTRMIHGLCAISFEVLRETYRTAKPCSNINPCKADEICFSNEELVATLTQSLSPTLSPVDISPKDAPSPSSDYRNSYSPTQSEEKPSVVDNGSIADVSTTYQIQTLQSTDDKSNSEYQSNGQHVVESNQKQESDDDMALDNPMDGAIFYCAETLKELEETCGTAQICDLVNPCPAGLGCIQYDYCQHEESQQESDKTVNFDLEQGIEQELHVEVQGKSEAVDESALPTYIPDLCPVGLVGLHALEGDCQQYHECNDGLLEASHKCQVTFMFDNRQGKCVDQRIVNYNCESPITDAETLDIILHGADDCPKGLVGLYARFPDCAIFYECNDEILMEVRNCDPGFSFDNVEGGCILEELVDSNCYSGQINDEPPPISEDDNEQSTYTSTSSTELNNEGTSKKIPDGDQKMYVWLREYEKNSAAMTSRAYWVAALLLSSIVLVFQNC